MTAHRTFLGLESSCDDTAAAIVRGGGAQAPGVLSNVVLGQNGLHDAFGGPRRWDRSDAPLLIVHGTEDSIVTWALTRGSRTKLRPVTSPTASMTWRMSASL